jgi:peptidoglycan/LPS O-acetylase OafA/YrhL
VVASTDRHTLISIQYLRAFAALFVVYHHAWDQLPWFKTRFPFEMGATGVDLFFVISGFVMVFITDQKVQTGRDFILARAKRIIPLYWFCTLCTAILLLCAPALFGKNAFTFPHLVLSLFFIPHPNPADPNALSPLVKLGWTLNYEMFFYLMFAIGIWIFGKKRVLFTCLSLLSIVGVGLALGDRAPRIVRVYADSIVLEFVLGMIVAILYTRGCLKLGGRRGAFLLVIGFVGLAVGALYVSIPRLVSSGIPSAAILMGALAIESSNQLALVRPLKLLGDASYSIYLWHLFPIAITRALWRNLAIPMDGWEYTACFVFVGLLAGASAGIVSYFLIERPSMALLRKSSSILPNNRPSYKSPIHSPTAGR